MNFKKIKYFFKAIDVFEQPIFLSYKGKTFYRTFAGGILTFMLISVIIAFSFEAAISLIIRENIKVAFSDIYEPDPPLIEISPNQGFTFAFGFSIDAINNSTEKYFDIQVENIFFKRMENGSRIRNSINIKLKTCDQNDFPIDYNYTTNNQQNWKCIDKNQTLTISGKYYSNLYKYVRLNIDRCVNSTLNNFSCATKEEMDEMAKQKIYFNFLFSNKILNLQNYQMPTINYLDTSVFFLLDPAKIFKQADIFFKINSITKDDNLWFYQGKESTEVTFQDFREQTMDAVGNRVASFYLNSSYKRGRYITSSDKITVMLSRLGGLMSIFYNLVGILVSMYARKKLLMSLSNFLYKYFNSNSKDDHIGLEQKEEARTSKEEAKTSKEKGGSNKTSPNKFPLKFSKFRIASYSESSNENQINNSQKNQIIYEINKESDSKQPDSIDVPEEKFSEEVSKVARTIKNYLQNFKKIRFNIFGSILKKFGKRNRASYSNAVIMEKAYKKLCIDMDIAEILQKNKEIDRLKDLLFENQERTLFEFFPRPILQVRDVHSKNKTIKKKTINNVLKGKIRPSNDFLKKVGFLKGSAEKQELYSYVELYKTYMSLKSRPTSEIPDKTLRLMKFVEQPLKELLNSEFN